MYFKNVSWQTYLLFSNVSLDLLPRSPLSNLKRLFSFSQSVVSFYVKLLTAQGKKLIRQNKFSIMVLSEHSLFLYLLNQVLLGWRLKTKSGSLREVRKQQFISRLGWLNSLRNTGYFLAASLANRSRCSIEFPSSQSFLSGKVRFKWC